MNALAGLQNLKTRFGVAKKKAVDFVEIRFLSLFLSEYFIFIKKEYCKTAVLSRCS